MNPLYFHADFNLPDRLPNEENDDWCRRAAASISAEALMREFVRYADSRTSPNWKSASALIGEFTGFGSGVSRALAERFRITETAEKQG